MSKENRSLFAALKKRILKAERDIARDERIDFVEETGASSEDFERFRWSLELRNLFALAAGVLFLLSLVLKGETEHLLRGIGYIAGAGAYLSEIVMLTEGFTRKVPKREAFMAFVFGPLYVLMGISYLMK